MPSAACIRRVTVVFLLAAVLTQCAAPVPPRMKRVPFSSRRPAAELIEEARAKWMILARSDDSAARDQYNAAVGKLFDQFLCADRYDWNKCAALIGTRIAPASGRYVDPFKLDAFFPARLAPRHTVAWEELTPGIGVPAVGWKTTAPVGSKRDPYLLPNGIPYNITVVLAFDGKGAPEWRFVKRWVQDDERVGRASRRLAANWTAPNAFFWKMCDLDNLLLQNLFLPERFTDETGLYFLQPYDPKKIPLVFVHGLISSPDAFKNAINDLAPEPWFRKNYQIWLYNYPTGNPWAYSAMNFRTKMKEAAAYARAHGGSAQLDRMVIAAHSMGGLVTRSSVTPPGTVFYDAHYNKPFDRLNCSARTKELIREATLYTPLREPQRVIFMAVPHRGSPWADFRPSLWFARLIRLPKTLTVDLLDRAFLVANDIVDGEADPTRDPITSINTLSPSNPDTMALANLPLPRGIVFHSIIGDRGKGNAPGGSDGVVPYWSSHIEPVASEKIVPSNHSVPDNREATEELKRILKLHLGTAASAAGAQPTKRIR